MNARGCTCHLHTLTEPGSAFCRVDHAAEAERTDALREQITQLPAFIDEALGNVPLDELITSYVSRDGAAVIAALDALAERYANECIELEQTRAANAGRQIGEAEAAEAVLALFLPKQDRAA